MIGYLLGILTGWALTRSQEEVTPPETSARKAATYAATELGAKLGCTAEEADEFAREWAWQKSHTERTAS